MADQVRVRIGADDQASKVVARLKNQLTGLSSTGPQLKNLFAGIGLGIAGAEGIRTVVKGFRELLEADGDLRRANDALRTSLGGVIQDTLRMEGSTGTLTERMQELTKYIEENRQQIVAWGEVAVKATKVVVQSFVAVVRAAFNLGQIVGGIFAELGEIIIGALTLDGDRIALAWGRLSESLKRDVGDIADSFKQVAESIGAMSDAIDSAQAGGKLILPKTPDLRDLKIPEPKIPGLTPSGAGQGGPGSTLVPGWGPLVDGDALINDFMATITKVKKVATKHVLELGDDVRGAVGGSIAAISETIGTLLTSATEGFETFGAALLSVLGSIMKQIGSAMIAFGTAGVAIRNFIVNPVAAIVAGAALVALGSALQGAAQNAINNATAASSGSGNAAGGRGGRNEVHVASVDPGAASAIAAAMPAPVTVNVPRGVSAAEVARENERAGRAGRSSRIPRNAPAYGLGW